MPVGVDEAGRGPVMGPLVICAAFHPDRENLSDLGVADSKLISKKKRESLFDRLKGIMSWVVVVVPAEVIDEARKKMTMNRLEVLGFSSAVASLLNGEELLHQDLPMGVSLELSVGSQVSGEVVLDAADVDEERFGREISSEVREMIGNFDNPVISKHKADRDDPVVGAASILAKVTRDRKIDEISRSIGKDIGSGYPSDVNTRRFMSEWVRENGDLPPHTRRSWETSRKLLNANSQPDLFSFE